MGGGGGIASPLGENHTLVGLGLQQLNHTQNAGLRALIQTANLQAGTIRERDISYVLAPRINAAGRMKHASIAFQLLTTGNDEAAPQVSFNYAQELEHLNHSPHHQTTQLIKL